LVWYVFDVVSRCDTGLSYFFFFQAEDGIRDDLVTGVQTCALPIWAAGSRSSDFGVNTTSGLRTSRWSWRRRRWKYWAGVDGQHTWTLSSAASVRKRSTLALECSGP